VMSRLSRGREKLRRYLSGEPRPAKTQLGKVK
jgi:DNA-directed RNA polymerase specialized sigma24 family protein